MARRVLIRLFLSLTLLVAAIAYMPSAEAACEYGYEITTTYYAWVDPSGWKSCTFVVVSPNVLSWEAIGGTTFNECYGTESSWGDTTSCPENYEQTAYRCGLVCQ
jgi:hypothetical protein